MKTKLISLVLLSATSFVTQAALHIRGGGLVYDDVLDITWLRDANYARTSGADGNGNQSFDNAKAFVDGLVYEGYNDWRLPSLDPINGVSFQYNTDGMGNLQVGFDLPFDLGYSAIAPAGLSSEIGSLYYHTLVGNLPAINTAGALSGCFPGACLNDTGPFMNLANSSQVYWFDRTYDGPLMGTGFPGPASDYAWFFEMSTGLQSFRTKAQSSSVSGAIAWAVRDGDSRPLERVPVPSAFLLFGSALIGLIGVNRKR